MRTNENCQKNSETYLIKDAPFIMTETVDKKQLEFPGGIAELSRMAKSYAKNKNFESAIQYYKRITELDESNIKAWTAVGHCYLLTADYQNCQSAYQRAISLSPETEDPQLWYGIGVLYHKFNNLERAEMAFQRALLISSDFEQRPDILYNLGIIYKRLKDYQKAILYFKSCLNTAQTNNKPEVLCQIGQSFEKYSNYVEAIKFYREALETDSGNYKAYEYLGWALTQIGKHTEAIETLNMALKHSAHDSAETGDIYYLIGLCNFSQQNYPEGQISIQKAIFRNPTSYIYWCSMGILYAITWQAPEAFECFVKSYTLFEDFALAWYNLGVLYEYCEQRAEALLAYQKACEIDNEFPAALRRVESIWASPNLIPQFIHPSIEVSDRPFSEIPKKPDQLPDISITRIPNDYFVQPTAAYDPMMYFQMMMKHAQGEEEEVPDNSKEFEQQKRPPSTKKPVGRKKKK